MRSLRFLVGLLLCGLFCSVSNAQLVSLGNSTESLTMVMAGAAATTNPVFNVTWVSEGGGYATQVGAGNGTASVEMLAGPGGGSARIVHTVSVYNKDTAAVTVTVRKTVAATSYELVKQSIPVGSTLVWNERSGITMSTPSAVANVGVVGGTGVTVSEQGNGVVQKSSFTFSNTPLTIPNAVAGTQGIGVKIYDFPEGRIFILGATGNPSITTTSVLASTLNTGVSCRWGVGTTVGTNATLATTEQDLIPVTTYLASATINVAPTVVPASLAAAVQFDGTGTPKDAYFNVSVPADADLDADATVAVNGTVTITWVFLGDY